MNDDLLRPLESETFANVAVTGSASYPKSGANGSTSAGSQTVTFAYDAASDSYTVSASGRSQTFAQADKDTSQSNDLITVYSKTSGSVTNSLTLSNPGTSGQLNYQYVGSGYWQRTTDGSSSIDATIDAFVYGVVTPDAALRRTGAAHYAVDLQGVIAYLDAPTSLLGSGTLAVDFETNVISVSGLYDEYLSDGSNVVHGYFDGSATLSSTENAFSGDFNLSAFPSAGTWNGSFFGPNTDEVGASFSYSMADGVSSVGTILGRYSEDVPTKATNANLVNLTKDVNFRSLGTGVEYSVDASGVYIRHTNSGNSFEINYEAATQTYSIGSAVPFGDGFDPVYRDTFGPDDLDAGASDDDFVAYTAVSGDTTGTLRLHRPAGSATDIQLTYTGFGSFETVAAGKQSESWFVYGLPTINGREYTAPTGTATYTGNVYGIATGSLASGGVGELSGTASLAVDFAASSFTGSMSPIATFADNSTLALGTYDFTIGQLNRGFPNGFNASIAGPGDDSGSLTGYFFGDGYTEFGAVFHVDTYATLALNEYTLDGVIVGTKD